MKLRAFSVLLLVLTACSSSYNGAGVASSFGDATYSSSDEYDVKIVQTASPMSFPNADKGKIDVKFDITIKNRQEKPVTIERISLQSMGGSLYSLETSSREYKQQIPAGASYTFKFWAPARVTDTMFDAKAPMVVRALVDTVVDETKTREVFNREVNDGFSVGARVGGN
jgi:hypothetical protein